MENRTTRKRIQLEERDAGQDKGQEKARLFYKGVENHIILYLHKTKSNYTYIHTCICIYLKGNCVTDLRKKHNKIHVPGTIILLPFKGDQGCPVFPKTI